MNKDKDNQVPTLSVVIATRCDDARADLLIRACDSVQSMADGHSYKIVVVANGPAISRKIFDTIAKRSDVVIYRAKTGSYPLARRLGAELAQGEFLAFLDDDDEFTPDSLEPKLDFFEKHPDVDVLITDGFRIGANSCERILPPAENRDDDLVRMMLQIGWGASALTIRREAVELTALDPAFRHFEWTLTALYLAANYRVGLLDLATYRYYEDSPNSLWRSADTVSVAPELWRRLLAEFRDTQYERQVHERLGEEMQKCARQYAKSESILKAWRLHSASIRCPRGFAYLPYTVRLIYQSLASFVK